MPSSFIGIAMISKKLKIINNVFLYHIPHLTLIPIGEPTKGSHYLKVIQLLCYCIKKSEENM